jgi:amphi-Trp domain-containing protein
VKRIIKPQGVAGTVIVLADPSCFRQAAPMAARDVETMASTAEFVAKLRRLADALESGGSFRIQVAGERFRVPRDARLSVEHERSDGIEEVELQLRWTVAEDGGDTDAADGPDV